MTPRSSEPRSPTLPASEMTMGTLLDDAAIKGLQQRGAPEAQVRRGAPEAVYRMAGGRTLMGMPAASGGAARP